MTLLRQIQIAASESQVSISTVLLKAKILAARLKNPEFAEWVECELNGYPTSKDVLPPYRILPVEAHGLFRSRTGLWWNDAPIMTSFLPDSVKVWGETTYIRQPIAAVVSAAASAGELQVEWPQEIAVRFGAKGYNGFECLRAWQIVSPHSLIAIVDTVRSRLLDFSLEIEAENPDAGEALPGIKPVPEHRVQMIVNNTFHAPVANVAQNGKEFTQTAE